MVDSRIAKNAERGRGLARRARAALSGVKRTYESRRSAAGHVEAVHSELDRASQIERRLRRRLRATREELSATRAELLSVRAELRATRESLRDPVPGIELPDVVRATIGRVRSERLTYLKRRNLESLARLVIDADRSGRPGLIVEAGTALGGSAIVMAAAKSPDRKMNVYDVFGMIPPPSDRDGDDVHARYQTIVSGQSQGLGGETYYGYRGDLYDEVTESFRRLGVPPAESGVSLIQGLFQDTIQLDEPVALAHLDGDWYESTMTCLTRIAPLLVPGGRIVVDDYYAWSGCHRAVEEYFAGRPGFVVERRVKVHVVRL